MTTYNTGNPVGSVDPKDLYDNAQNLDALVNSTTEMSHADRLAVQRKTWHGMEVEFDAAQAERAGEFAQFLADSAYQDLGVYGAGIEVTRYNQVFLKDGEFYRAAASLGLPYTTTGLWASESGIFVGVGDAVLRQDLGAPGGSALVGYDDGTAQDVLDNAKPVANYTALRNYTGRATGVRITQSGLAGFFQRDDADTTSADNGGTIIVDASGRRWKRLYAGPLNVMWFGAVGDGITNDTDSINAAISVVKAQTKGGEVYFPQPRVAYAVTEINMTSATSDFTKSIKLSGDGRFRSLIIPFSAGGVLLNMLGMNNAVIQGLHFDSSNLVSQAAIFMARSTTSGNCNNNKFYDTWVTGSYTVASVVSNGSESSYWFGGRIENGNSSASYRCLWSGGGSLIGGLQGITVVNGGTISNTNNPNTDNKMFGVEFYAPFASANPVRFSQSAGYAFVGCTIITGNGANVKMVQYGDPSGGRFNGSIVWADCHFEGTSATNVVVHFLDVGGATSEVTFKGISSRDCAVVVNAASSYIDFDRTAAGYQPTLEGCSIGGIDLPPNTTGLDSYVTVLRRSSFRQPGAKLKVFGFMSQSELDVETYRGTDVQGLGKVVEFGVSGLPASGTYVKGTTLTRQDPTVGQPVAYKVTVSGTLGTLNSGATTLAAEAVAATALTFNTTAGLETGQKLNIGGTLVWVRKIYGATVYVSGAVTKAVGTAVAFSAPTIVALPNL